MVISTDWDACDGCICGWTSRSMSCRHFSCPIPSRTSFGKSISERMSLHVSCGMYRLRERRCRRDIRSLLSGTLSIGLASLRSRSTRSGQLFRIENSCWLSSPLCAGTCRTTSRVSPRNIDESHGGVMRIDRPSVAKGGHRRIKV